MKRPFIQLSLASRTMMYSAIVLSAVVAVEVWLLSNRTALANASGEEVTELTPMVDVSIGVSTPRAPSLAVYSEITDRPLFSPTRRPLAPSAATSSKAGRAANQFSKLWKLTGVVMAGDDSYVLVESRRDRRTEHLLPGELIDGWRLDEISANGVTLVSGSESVRLELHERVAKDQ